ncbi:MAG: DUF1294 domain-containing protein [Bacteroidia bacterium]
MLREHWSHFLYGLLFINSLAYACMWSDKVKAIRRKRRITENQLLLLALCFGATGIYLGMKKPLYHKAGKPSFRFLVPVLFLLQFVTLACFLLINTP